MMPNMQRFWFGRIQNRKDTSQGEIMNQANIEILDELADLIVQIERSRVLDVEIAEPEIDDFEREIRSLNDLTNKELQEFVRFGVESLQTNLPPEMRSRFEMLNAQRPH